MVNQTVVIETSNTFLGLPPERYFLALGIVLVIVTVAGYFFGDKLGEYLEKRRLSSLGVSLEESPCIMKDESEFEPEHSR